MISERSCSLGGLALGSRNWHAAMLPSLPRTRAEATSVTCRMRAARAGAFQSVSSVSPTVTDATPSKTCTAGRMIDGLRSWVIDGSLEAVGAARTSTTARITRPRA